MAEVKWIKLNTDMFDNAKIKYLRTLPEGDKIVLIWVMLLAKAGKCNANGYIFLTETIPYTQEMLAAEFDFEITTIQLALGSLMKLGMINLDESNLCITGWEEHQNVEGLDKIREQTRLRVAKYRDKQKLIMESLTCQYCGDKATGYDHILATSRGGKDVDSNKVPCCIECNRIKNDKPLIDFLNNNRERINDGIVTKNSKLKAFVTLCNATDRYEVTQGNGTEEEREEEKERDKDNNKKEKRKTEFDLLIEGYTEDLQLRNTIYEFLKMRKAIKAPMTSNALKLMLNKLDRLAPNDIHCDTRIAILEQSIMNSWKGIFELKEELKKKVVPEDRHYGFNG